MHGLRHRPSHPLPRALHMWRAHVLQTRAWLLGCLKFVEMNVNAPGTALQQV